MRGEIARTKHLQASREYYIATKITAPHEKRSDSVMQTDPEWLTARTSSYKKRRSYAWP